MGIKSVISGLSTVLNSDDVFDICESEVAIQLVSMLVQNLMEADPNCILDLSLKEDNQEAHNEIFEKVFENVRKSGAIEASKLDEAIQQFETKNSRH